MTQETNKGSNPSFSGHTSSAPYIYQIFYSEETRESNDPGFRQLDNLNNERPDWREYWPIRKFLTENKLDPTGLYGFFSPKFHSKTTLKSSDVFDFISESDSDIYLFSPFFDQSAFQINVFDQAESNHPGIFSTLEATFKILDDRIDIDDLIMDSSTTVFCNYFVAKPKFWEKWLAHCEKIYEIAETPSSELGQALNKGVSHEYGPAPAKVFAIERVASFMLTTEKWNTAVFDPMKMNYSTAYISLFKPELAMLDALKAAHIKTRFPRYLEIFIDIRLEISRKLELIGQKTPKEPKKQFRWLFWRK